MLGELNAAIDKMRCHRRERLPLRTSCSDRCDLFREFILPQRAVFAAVNRLITLYTGVLQVTANKPQRVQTVCLFRGRIQFQPVTADTVWRIWCIHRRIANTKRKYRQVLNYEKERSETPSFCQSYRSRANTLVLAVPMRKKAGRSPPSLRAVRVFRAGLFPAARLPDGDPLRRWRAPRQQCQGYGRSSASGR